MNSKLRTSLNLGLNQNRRSLAQILQRDAIEYWLEEAGHNHMNGIVALDTAREHMEQLLFLDLAAGRCVAGLDIVSIDLQARDRVAARGRAEMDGVLLQPRVGALSAVIDFDHAVKGRVAAVVHHSLEVQMTLGVR